MISLGSWQLVAAEELPGAWAAGGKIGGKSAGSAPGPPPLPRLEQQLGVSVGGICLWPTVMLTRHSIAPLTSQPPCS